MYETMHLTEHSRIFDHTYLTTCENENHYVERILSRMVLALVHVAPSRRESELCYELIKN